MTLLIASLATTGWDPAGGDVADPALFASLVRSPSLARASPVSLDLWVEPLS